MNVLLVNGSPHADGCTFSALSEMARALKKQNIDSEIFHIGSKPIQGCTACFRCGELGTCVFQDDVYSRLVEKIKNCDAFVVGAPVYYAGPPGTLCALLDRVFFSAGQYLKFKPAAGIVNCRRGGASAAFDRLNKYFTINLMPVATSQYWNSTHGHTPEDQKHDEEGLQTMRTLAYNLAWLMKNAAAGHLAGVDLPEQEDRLCTNFI